MCVTWAKGEGTFLPKANSCTLHPISVSLPFCRWHQKSRSQVPSLLGSSLTRASLPKTSSWSWASSKSGVHQGLLGEVSEFIGVGDAQHGAQKLAHVSCVRTCLRLALSFWHACRTQDQGKNYVLPVDSWVSSEQGKRVFFGTTPFLPQQTPPSLVPLRVAELKAYRVRKCMPSAKWKSIH